MRLWFKHQYLFKNVNLQISLANVDIYYLKMDV